MPDARSGGARGPTAPAAAAPTPPAARCQPPAADANAMPCDRCATPMFRMHAVWRCPACGYKTDCCGW